MFKMFRNTIPLDKENEMLIRVFSLLPNGLFSYIKNQLNDGIVEGVKREKNYTKIILNLKILNKYEDKLLEPYLIKGIKIFDKRSGRYIGIEIEIVYGLLFAYSTSVQNIEFDLNKIDVGNFFKQTFANIEFSVAKSLLQKRDLALVNPSDVYEVIIDGTLYYHLFDIQDGDFVGVDLNKNLFKISHDPFRKQQIETLLGIK